jgi:hypothetical protein
MPRGVLLWFALAGGTDTWPIYLAIALFERRAFDAGHAGLLVICAA